MKPIPESEQSLILRTDFSDEAAWQSICEAIQQPDKDFGYKAQVEFLSDPEYDGITLEQVLSLLPQGWSHSFLFIADHTTVADAEQPILVMDLYTERGRTFRVIPSEMNGVETNLSLANMDFEEFADAVDADGIFRGFPRY